MMLLAISSSNIAFETVDCNFGNSVVSVECQTATVPLQRTSTGDPSTIKIFFRVYKSLNQSQTEGQLWLLGSYLGTSGKAFESMAPSLRTQLLNRYDIYVPDHRGTGRSINNFFCEWEQNLKSKKISWFNDAWGCFHWEIKNKGYKSYTTTEASRDVIDIMKAKRTHPNEPIVVFGISYGTYWLNRILQIEPSIISAAAFDSVLNPVTIDFLENDNTTELAGHKLIEACQREPGCLSQFFSHGSVSEVLKKAFNKQKKPENRCHFGITAANIRHMLFHYIQTRELRNAVLPLILRIERCEYQDWKFLDNLFYIINREQHIHKKDPLRMHANHALERNIICSEMIKKYEHWQHRNFIYLERSREFPYYFGDAQDYYNFEMCVAQGNEFYEDPLSFSYSNYNGPMITLQGDMDDTSGYANALKWKIHFDNINPTHRFLHFPNVGHGVILNSQRKSSSEGSCGRDILASFLLSRNSSSVDMSCISNDMINVPQYEFLLSPTVSLELFNVSDPWIDTIEISQTETINRIFGIYVVPSILAFLGILLSIIGIFFIAILLIKKLRGGTKQIPDTPPSE